MSGLDGLGHVYYSFCEAVEAGPTYAPADDASEDVWSSRRLSDNDRLQLANKLKQNNQLDKARNLYSFLITSDDLHIAGEAYYGLACIAESTDTLQDKSTYIERAANFGHAQAQYEYGLSLKDSDKGAAFMWLSAAVNRGCVSAAREAGKIAIADSKDESYGKEVAKDLRNAAIKSFFQKLAVGTGTHQEQVAAASEAYKFGVDLLSLQSETEEVDSALKLFKFAAENGHILFQGQLDRSYEKYFKAETGWCQFFAEKDEKKFDAHLAYVVGMSLKGTAIGKAMLLLKKAADEGHAGANFELSKLFSDQSKSTEAKQAIWDFYKKEQGQQGLDAIKRHAESKAAEVGRPLSAGWINDPIYKEARNEALSTYSANQANIFLTAASSVGYRPAILEKARGYEQEAERNNQHRIFNNAHNSLEFAMHHYSKAAEKESPDDLLIKQNRATGGSVYGTVGSWLIHQFLTLVNVGAAKESLTPAQSKQLSDGVKCLELAVASGYKGSADYVKTYSMLGKMYEEGNLVPQSYKRAIYYRNLAVQLKQDDDNKAELDALEKAKKERGVISGIKKRIWGSGHFSITPQNNQAT